MGLYYRKSISLGPFRINASKSGLGYSVGGRGFRTGVSGAGRKYTSFSLPGTGVGYRTSKGCAFVLIASLGVLAAGGSVAVAWIRTYI